MEEAGSQTVENVGLETLHPRLGSTRGGQWLRLRGALGEVCNILGRDGGPKCQRKVSILENSEFGK